MSLEKRLRDIIKGTTISASASKRHYMSRQHFSAAVHFAAEAERIESEFPPPQNDSDLTTKHRAYVTSAIFSSVACLEASINELYLDCVYLDKSVHALQGLPDGHREFLADSWPKLDKRRAGILSKYRHALRIANAPQFEPKKMPYEEVERLIQLRHRLTHYIPEMDNDPVAKHVDVRKSLEERFAPNPYSSPHETLWFPHVCLGSGCANWAVDSTKAFLDQFSQAMSIPNRL